MVEMNTVTLVLSSFTTDKKCFFLVWFPTTAFIAAEIVINDSHIILACDHVSRQGVCADDSGTPLARTKFLRTLIALGEALLASEW